MNQKKKNLNIFLIVVILGMMFFGFSQAAPESVINYQGKLTDDDDVAVSDGNYDFVFKIYDAASGGNCLWASRGTCGSPTAKSVAVENGIFSTQLGESGDNALNLDFNSQYWLGVKIGSDSEMSPRKKITAAGFALNSALLDGLDSAESGTNAHIVKTDSSGNLTASANLNIGDSLTLSQGSSNRLDLASGDSLNIVSGNLQIGATTVLDSSRILQNITQATIDSIQIDGNTISATNDSGIYLYDNASNGIFIQDGGNVGIGTTSPGAKLHVEGDLFLGSTSGKRIYGGATATESDFSSFIELYNATDGSMTFDVGYSNADIKFNTQAGEVLRIDQNGNVGIGTTSPITPLHIKKSNPLIDDLKMSLFFEADRARFGYGISPTADAKVAFGSGWLTPEDFAVHTKTSGLFSVSTQRFTVKMNGNVGIGTTGPSSLLHLYSSSASPDITLDSVGANDTKKINFASAGSSKWQLGHVSGSNEDFQLWDASVGAIITAEKTGGVANSLYIKQGNVGIGTTSPNKSLHIAGNLATLRFEDDTPGRYVDIVSSDGRLILRSDTDSIAATSYISFEVDGSERTRINASGNMGIGTTSPGYDLDVVGDLRVQDSNEYTPIMFYLDNTHTTGDGSSLQYRAKNSNNDYGVLSDLRAEWVDNTSGSEGSKFHIKTYDDGVFDTRFVIKEGNVGIGTTAPGAKLDVFGTNNKLRLSYDTSNYADISARASGEIFFQPKNGRTYFNGSGVDNSFYAYDYSVTAPYPYLTLSAHTIKLNSPADSGAGKVYITDNGSSYFNGGNVGIGTTSPGAKLDVQGDIKIGTHPTTNKLIFGDASNYFGRGTISTTQTNLGLFNTYATGYITLNTNGSERVRVNYDGNVGIGTTGPVGKLQIGELAGMSTVIGMDEFIIAQDGVAGMSVWTPDASSGYYNFGTPSDTHGAALSWNYDDSLMRLFTAKIGGELAFETGNKVEAMRITNTGNIGIGTTSPAGKLNVLGDTTVVYIDDNGDNYADEANQSSLVLRGRYWSGSTTDMSYSQARMRLIKGNTDGNAGSDLAFDVMNLAGGDSVLTERMRITGSGNVGIGTTSPGAKLEVYGKSTSAETVSLIVMNDRVDTGIDNGAIDVYAQNNVLFRGFQSDGAGGGTQKFNFGYSSDSGNIAFLGYGSNKNMVIDSSGNVGIGTIGPGYKLDVNGTLASVSDITANYDLSGNGNIIIGAGTTGISGINFNDGSNDGIIRYDHSDRELEFFTAATQQMTIDNTGNVGIGITSPTAYLHLKAGTASASTAPLKLTAGTNLTTAETGALEYDGTDLYFTPTGTTRETIAYLSDITGAAHDPVTVLDSSTIDLTLSTQQLTAGVITGSIGDTQLAYDTGQHLTTTSSPTFGGLTLNGNLALGANTLTTTNTTLVSNLNADLLDGQHASAFQPAGSYDNYVSWSLQDGDTTTYPLTSGDTLQIASGTGVTSNFTADDVLTIINTDLGSSQSIFKNLAVSGQTTVTADANSDTLTFVNGSNVTITTNATSDSITIAATDTNTTYTAGSGLTLSGTTFKLGGTLAENTTITQGAYDMVYNLNSTGDFILQDNGTPFFTASDTGTVTIDSLYFDGTTIGHTSDTDLLSLASGSLTLNGNLDLNGSIDLDISVDDYAANFYNSNTGSSAGGLYIRSDGLGNLLTLNYAGSDLMTVSPAQTTFNNPTAFTSAGDVSIAYDLYFTNSTASHLRSSSSLYIEAGEVYNSDNLALKTYNSGKLVLDTPGGLDSQQAQNWSLISDVNALNIESGLFNIDTANSRIGIGTISPGEKLDVSGGSIRTTNQFISTLATGTSPLSVTSTTLNTNLNADLLDGQHGSYYMPAATDNWVDISGDTMTGDLTVGSTSRTADTYVRALAGDLYNAGFEAYGNSQGTGYLYVGQSTTYGGGIFYNGDGNPAFATGESSDRISFYRNTSGAKEVVFSYLHNSNDVAFRGAISAASTIAGSNLSGTNTGDQNLFSSLAVSGQTTVTADANSDTLTLINGSNVTITTNATSDEITIAATDTNTTYTAGSGLTLSGNTFKLGGTISENTALDLYSSADYDLRFYNSNSASEMLFLDGSTGNVGIGITAPGQKLDVSGGSIRTTNQFISTLATGTSPLSVTSTTLNTNLNADLLDGYHASSFQLALTNPVTGTGTTGYLPKFTGTSTLGDSVIYDDGTNVGIGTTTPGTYKLYVNGNQYIGGNLDLSGTVDGKDIATYAAMLNEAETITADWVNTANPWADNEVADAITISGGTISSNNISGILTTTGSLTIGDGGDTITVNSSNWDVSSAGIISGLTGITSSGTVTLSGIANDAAEATAILINGSNQLVYRELGSNAFSSSTYDNYQYWTLQDGDTTTYTQTSLDTLQIASGTGITSNFTADDVLTITNTDLGSSQNIFKNIAVSGQTTVTADANSDTLTLINGSNVTITTNATSDEITIAATDIGFVNPMTTAGDLIYGGTSGAPTRLAGSATNGYVLKYNTATSTPYWGEESGGSYTAGSGLTLSSTTFKLGGTISENTNLDLYSSAHYDLRFYNSNSAKEMLFLDGSTGNIGIGTTLPDSKLSILGSANQLKVSYDNSNYSNFSVDASSNLSITPANAGTTTIGSGSSALWVATSGNVGIGTSDPGKRLTIQDFSNQLRLGYDSSNFTDFSVDASSNLSITPANAGTTTIGSGVSALWVATSGNVGIGISSPTQLLTVNGAMRLVSTATPTSPTLGDIYTDADGNLYFFNGSTWDDLTGAGGGSSYSAGSGLTLAVTTFKLGGSISENTNLNLYSSADYDLRFYNSNSASEMMFLDGSAGNVGIGTTAPGSKLTVQGGANQLKIAYDSSNYANFSVDSSSNLSITPAGSGTTTIGSGVSALWVATSGNVGIGTSSPAQLLHVNGAMRLTSVATPGTPALGDIYTNADGNLYFFNGSTWDDLTGAGGESLWTANGSNIYFNTGNVGIGTSNPSNKLSIQDASANQLKIAYDSSNYANFSVDSSSNLSITPAGSGTTTIGSGVSALWVATSGNVGIGTSSPAQLLHVNGAMRLTSVATPGTPALGDIYTNADGNLYFFNGSTWDDLTGAGGESLWTANGSNIYFNTGNVGIGTTAPGSKLTVFSATAPQFRIAYDSSNYADFSVDSSSNMTIAPANYGTVSIGGGDEIMWLTNDGNVGIGTSSPAQLLHVDGAMRLASVSAPTSPTLGDLYTNADGNLYFYNGSSWDDLTATGGSYTAGSGLTLSSTTFKLGGTISENTNLNLYSSADYDLRFYNSNSSSEMLFLDGSAGNIGIGTTAPAEKLDVAGRIYLADSSAPGTTTNRLYASSGNLYWNGSRVSTDASLQKTRLSGNYTNATTTLTDVDDDSTGNSNMAISAGANETWIVEYQVQYSATTTADGYWQVTAPSGASCALGMQEIETGAQTVANVDCGSAQLLTSTGTADTFNIYGTVVNGSTAGSFQLQYRQSVADGTSTVYAGSYVKGYRIDGADLAEVYYSDQGVMPLGNIVSLRKDKTNYVNSSEEEYDQNVLGVVSTRPGMVIGEADGDFGVPVMVALSGRVPVLVTSENGPIEAGDRIASSGISGAGMKASRPGQTVGIALESFDPNDPNENSFVCPAGFPSDQKCAKVMMFIQNEWFDPTIVPTDSGLVYDRSDATAKYGELESEIINTNKLSINGKELDAYLNEKISDSYQLRDELLKKNNLTLSSYGLELEDFEKRFENLEKLTADFSEKFTSVNASLSLLENGQQALDTQINQAYFKLANLENSVVRQDRNMQTVDLYDFRSEETRTSLEDIVQSEEGLFGKYIQLEQFQEAGFVLDELIDLSELETAGGFLEYEIYISDADVVLDYNTEFGNEMDAEELQWYKEDHPWLVDGWNKISLPIDEGTATSDVRWEAVDYFRTYFKFSSEVEIKIKNIVFRAYEKPTIQTDDYFAIDLENYNLTDQLDQASAIKVIDGQSRANHQAIEEWKQSQEEEMTLVSQTIANMNDFDQMLLDVVNSHEERIAVLEGQVAALLGGEDVAIFSGAGYFSLDSEGNLVADQAIKTPAIETQMVSAAEYKLKESQNQPAANGNVGSVIIYTGQQEVFVANSKVMYNSKIIVTPVGSNPVNWVVSEKINNQGFKIRLSEPAGFDIAFDYWIIEVE